MSDRGVIGRLPAKDRGAAISLILEGREVRAFDRETVAVALYASKQRVLTRSLKYHRPRGFFCLEGHCGGCLMRIGGVPNLRACVEPARQNLAVEGQNAYPSPEHDVLGAVDWLFPKGMDHHRLFTGSRILNKVVNRVVRELSGLGELPDEIATGALAPRRIEIDIVIVGAGPAGLAAAEAAASTGAEVLLVDEHPVAGGSLLATPGLGPEEAARRVERATAAGAVLSTRSAAIGFFGEDSGGVLAVTTPAGLLEVSARRIVYATGGYSVNRLFEDNDRPGVLAARAVGRLLVEHRVRPGDRIAVVGNDDYADTLSRALADEGIGVIALDGEERRILRARGRTWVSAVDLLEGGKKRQFKCDLLAVSATPAPASELPRQHGCEVRFEDEGGGFALATNENGETSVAGVFGCGDVCGFAGPEAAARAGARVGARAAEELSR